MKKLLSKFQINVILVILLFILEIKKYHDLSYDILIKNYINNVYISEHQLNITQLIFLISLYTLMLWNFINVFSVSLNNFKVIIKFHSKNIIQYYFKVILYLFKNLLFSYFGYIFIFNIIYIYKFKEICFRSLLIGNLEIVKIYFLFFMILLINTVFNFNKVIVIGFCYLTIVIYIVFLNNISFVYYYLIMILVIFFSIFKMHCTKDL